jgi:hypothetical protein
MEAVVALFNEWNRLLFPSGSASTKQPEGPDDADDAFDASIQVMKSTESNNETAEAEDEAAPHGSESERSGGGAQDGEDAG